jgi:hypothetical protein
MAQCYSPHWTPSPSEDDEALELGDQRGPYDFSTKPNLESIDIDNDDNDDNDDIDDIDDDDDVLIKKNIHPIKRDSKGIQRKNALEFLVAFSNGT